MSKRRRAHGRKYRANPGMLGGMKECCKLPSWGTLKAEVKAHPVKTIGIAVLGLADTGLIGMVTNYACGQMKCGEPVRDTVRIVAKLGVGTLMSYGVNKMVKNGYGKIHQIGVYANTILDVVGTVLKYSQRDWKVSNGGYQMPLTPMNVAAEIFGIAPILNAMSEKKMAKALDDGGVVVAKGDNGHVALANANTGEILVSGPEAAMKPVIQSLKGFQPSSWSAKQEKGGFQPSSWSAKQEKGGAGAPYFDSDVGVGKSYYDSDMPFGKSYYDSDMPYGAFRPQFQSDTRGLRPQFQYKGLRPQFQDASNLLYA